MKKIVELENISGVVFDLDGTILDSSWVWDKVDIDFLGSRGYEVPDDYVEVIAPMGALKAAIYTKERFHLENENVNDIVNEWIAMAKKEYAQDVICRPHIKDYLEKLHQKGIKMAIATSSERELFLPTLGRENIDKYFEHIVTVSDVKKQKSFPDIYLEAAKRIGVSPQECIVFEDILTAVIVAKKAGFNVVAIKDVKSFHNEAEMKKIAHMYIEDYKELL